MVVVVIVVVVFCFFFLFFFFCFFWFKSELWWAVKVEVGCGWQWSCRAMEVVVSLLVEVVGVLVC